MSRTSFLNVYRGSTRWVVLTRWLAFKLPRLGSRGRACNLWELNTWRVDAVRFAGWREVLCPVLWGDPWGWLLVMPRTAPVTEEALQQGVWERDFDPSLPTEHKVADWGVLSDGRVVAHDYAMPALDPESERERRQYLDRFDR